MSGSARSNGRRSSGHTRVAGLVFLLCFTSFSLVLMLGGGPAVTTLEVSIYTALRFDFDMPMAGKLALLQLMICAGVVILLTMLTGRSWAGASAAPARLSRSVEMTPYPRAWPTASFW